jgi:hypothetical protein
VKNNFGIIIWDIKELFGLTYDHVELYYQLEDFLFKAFNEPIGELKIINNDESQNIIPNFQDFKFSKRGKKIVKLEGDKLTKVS